MSNSHYVGGKIVSSTIYRPSSPISRVTLVVDDETQYTAGDDTGAEIVATCPYATQGMVDSLLLALGGKIYQAYYAEEADIDPLAELGDGVNVDGIYSMLATIDDDGMGYPDIGAPGEDELEDEYPVKGNIEQTINRNMATTRALISKTASEISLRVESAEAGISELKVTLDGVTISDESGTTRIKGSSIDTDSLNAHSISADKLLLTDSISWADLSDDVKNEMGDENPDYIHSTYIDETRILSPEIYGGMFYATGMGAEETAAYYIYDGAEISRGGNVTLGNKVGFLSYDTNGSGISENENRVLLTTLDGTALKINASGNMSLEADEIIYVHTPLAFADVSYGEDLPETATHGQIYFLLTEGGYQPKIYSAVDGWV